MKTKKERITYIDDDILWSDFPEIIIKVDSINEKYGSLNEFVKDCNLKGTTNGKLFVLENKEKTDKDTQEFIDNLTKIFDLEEKKDYLKTIYYNKTLAEKMEKKRNMILHNYDKGWLWLKDYIDGAEMWYMPEENKKVKNETINNNLKQ